MFIFHFFLALRQAQCRQKVEQNPSPIQDHFFCANARHRKTTVPYGARGNIHLHCYYWDFDIGNSEFIIRYSTDP